jgi:hypothetical protein
MGWRKRHGTVGLNVEPTLAIAPARKHQRMILALITDAQF